MVSEKWFESVQQMEKDHCIIDELLLLIGQRTKINGVITFLFRKQERTESHKTNHSSLFNASSFFKTRLCARAQA